MALLGHIEEFSPKHGEWNLYAERLEFYFKANKINDDPRKCAVLFTVCGPATYATIRSLVTPKAPTELTFDEIKTLMKKHFNPAPSEIVCRFKFHKRDQHTTESIAQYVSTLRCLTEHCKFGESLNDMLRDRLVCGVADESLQRRLLSKTTLTFEEAEKEAIASEVAQKQTLEIRAPTSNTMVQKINQAKKNMNTTSSGDRTENKRCMRCGGEHKNTPCRYTNTRCNFCKKVGHLERVCISKAKSQQNPNKAKGSSNARVALAHTIVEEHENDSYYALNNVNIDHKKPITTTVALNGKQLEMEIDSGSAFSIINDCTYHKLFNDDKPLLTSPNTKIRTWNHEALCIVGEIQVRVDFQGKSQQLPLLVVEGKGTSLLGRNWFSFLGIEISGVHFMKADIVNNIMKKYGSVFKEELGAFNGPPIRIELETGAQPIFMKSRPVPFALRAKVEKAIDVLISQGILEPVQHSNWATPVVTILKKNGELRLCGDYKCTVNKATKKDTYPLPSIKELLASLAGGTVFTRLDLAQAYQQLLVDEASSEILTLNTSKGLMKVKRLQFGIDVAPGIFQRYMDTWLNNIEGAMPYLDDVLVMGKTLEEHNARLELVLQRFDEAGLRLQRDKCIFAVPELEFLGFRIDAQGVHPTSEKVEAIQQAPAPTNKTELQSFLGLLNFYNNFLPGRADILEPLHRLLDKDRKWEWKYQQAEAFDKAKELLQSSSVLVHYDPEKPLLLCCDASSYGVGAVLSHLDSNLNEAPIAYASRTLSSTERNYSQIDREALSVIFAVKKFHQYILGRRFVIYTDHKPLLGLLQNGKPLPQVISPRMLRWSLMLGAYDYELKYRPGKQLGNADGLSRLPMPTAEKEITPPGDILLLEAMENPPLDAKRIRQLTAKDPILALVQRWTLRGWPPKSPNNSFDAYFTHQHELSTHRGCVLWGSRVVIPSKLHDEVLKMLHEGHPGIVQMKGLARSYVWWPGMDKEIEETVKKCELCQQSRPAPNRAPTYSWEKTGNPWSRLHIDFAGPYQGKVFLIIVDSHSKWLEVVQVSSMTSATAIEKLSMLFATHGLPDLIVSDNATTFSSQEFKQFTASNGIRFVQVAPYHPRSNGQAERMVQTTKQNLKTIIHGNWHMRLARFLFKQHVTPCASTGFSPAELLMKRKLKTLLDNLHPDTLMTSDNRNDQFEQESKNDVKTRHFNTGDTVYMRNYTPGNKWIPSTVVHPTGPVSYQVITPEGAVHKRHIDQLRERMTVENQEEPPDENSREEEEYEQVQRPDL